MKVEATSGTGALENEVFYQTRGFSAQGQSLGIEYGNGLQSTNLYYTNSKRLSAMYTWNPSAGTTNQHLTYTYDRVSNIKTITMTTTMGPGIPLDPTPTLAMKAG